VEMNEETGAASGLAMGLTGLMTIIAVIIFA
jgi:putative effector of murein hydrolase